MTYTATPYDRSAQERRVESKRVEFDGLPDDMVILAEGHKVEKDILVSFRQDKYGK